MDTAKSIKKKLFQCNKQDKFMPNSKGTKYHGYQSGKMKPTVT